MTQLDLIDMLEATGRRDACLAKVEAKEPDWFALALIQLGQLHKRRAVKSSFTFEDVIEAITPLIGNPPSKYVPGALCMQAVRLKLIEKTGEYRKGKSASKNAHASPVYRWT